MGVHLQGACLLPGMLLEAGARPSPLSPQATPSGPCPAPQVPWGPPGSTGSGWGCGCHYPLPRGGPAPGAIRISEEKKTWFP